MSFEGRVVLISGASRGLGRALAEAFRARGARVVGTYRAQAAKAEAVCDLALPFDLDRPETARDLLAQVVSEMGGVDVFLNNAARTGGGFFGFGDGLEPVVGADLVGAGVLLREVVRTMLPRGRGVILNLGSVASVRPPPGQAAYAAAKGGLDALTRALARELAPRGIRVNALLPGLLEIGSAARMPRDQRDRWLAEVPLGRPGRAEEAVEAALWLCSEEAAYVVGHLLCVDGGLAIR